MSTDAFAAAVGRGASRRPSVAKAMRAGAVFGIIEALTPVIGWMLGILAASFVQQVDHWIAFSLLAIVGGKMIIDAIAVEKVETAPARSGLTALIATAVGTSLDAAAIGVGLALIGVNIWVIAASIGFTTFVFTTFGMLIGGMVGARFGRWAEIAGGVVLIGIGTVILLDHLGYLG
ncbi:manganese efflux pump MntP [Hephaestia mangrovi]|uniref:manganese efflux pump MntP n=1 Tax=Hephaestia mangrovi TaxID=2873268 RepID=UPI001CA606CA|nr:manganese efflux pump MntP family protein [Hephaestia mangrovi]MBY8829642.1 manganese efflux pump MntP family protein [Hephaestia mangrovi]